MLRVNSGAAAAARDEQRAREDDDFSHLAASWLDDVEDDDVVDGDSDEGEEGEVHAVEADEVDAVGLEVEADEVEEGEVDDGKDGKVDDGKDVKVDNSKDGKVDEVEDGNPSFDEESGCPPSPVDDKAQDPERGDAASDQDAVVPWETSSEDRAEEDGDDTDDVAGYSESASDDWTTPMATSATESPATRRTLPAATHFAHAEPDEPKPHSVSEFLLGTEPRSKSLRSEIRLLDQATEKAAAAAAAMDSSLDRVRGREMTSRSSTSALPRYHDTALTAANEVTPPPRTATSEALAEARVHPIAIAAPVVDKESERQKATSLSPNSLRRANSVYLTPTSTSKTLMKRQDSLTANVSRSQMLWNSDATRRSSRMLDEWKRKEIWHDFKRAEVSVSGPQAKNALATVAAEKEDATTAGSRLETLLQNLRAEISLPFHMADKPSRSSSTTAALFTATADGTSTSTGSVGHRTNTPKPTTSHPVFEQQGHERRESVAMSPTGNGLVSSSTMQPGCSRSEYEQLLQEKRTLVDELENRTRVSTTDKEIIRNMSDRIQQLENSDRENKFLKEEIQRHVMHELNSKEQLKTLGEQLSLTTKSEEQLKLQTQQLFQQNQSLQSDLLEKIAAEASKIQKMAHLTAEKENLMQELERKEAVLIKRRRREKEQLQQKSVRHLFRIKRLSLLRTAMTRWQVTTERVSAIRSHAMNVFVKAHRLIETKAMAKAFHRLQTSSIRSKHQVIASDLRKSVDESKRNNKTLAEQILVWQLAQVVDRWRTRRQNQALRMLHAHNEMQHKRETTLELGFTKLGVLVSGRTRCEKQSAFAKWKAQAQLEAIRASYGEAMRNETELNEAKDCVFSLSREKTRLEEKLQKSREEFKRQADQLIENTAELQVVKHGYVSTVIRDLERGWLRSLFFEWRLQTIVSLATKDLRLQSEMAELKAAERDKHAKTVDDYNRVLRNDLERFQFFSQDKRIAVDVLTKKLLREEEKIKQMEEHQVLLEERAHSLRSQLSAFVEWEGLELPLSMLLLSKDIAINNLKELFLLHATVTPDPSTATAGYTFSNSSSNETSDSGSSRLSMDSLLRMIEYSTLLEETQTRKEELPEVIARHFPDYAVKRGVLFPDFIAGLNKVLQEAFRDNPSKSERMKTFWGSLLALVDLARYDATGNGSGGREHLISGRSPWAGRLSEDILQNQEKLLAMLEHETAVVERAVMEKSSLKHTYPTSEHASVASTYFEYQCDPMLPPEPSNGTQSMSAVSTLSPASQTPRNVSVLAVPAEIYTDWYQTAQIRDLFLAFHKPLLKVLMKYSNETRVASHNNQYCLQLQGILRMLEDLKLHPTYLTKDSIHLLFGNLCDRDGYLTPQAFTLFLGSCALELYTKSLSSTAKSPTFPLSAREILISFFCDLGFLAESASPPLSRICFVGIEIETILWSLFEYYSTTDEPGATRAEDERVSMTSTKFTKFMTEIAGTGAGAEEAYRRVQTESRRAATRPVSSSSSPPQWGMYFDDFYSAISYIQEARNKQITYSNPGEAVRQWMQQTQ